MMYRWILAAAGLVLVASLASAQTVTINAPAGYQQANLAVGITYYTDRTYTVTTVPATVAGGRLIKPANNDKTATAASTWLQFTLSHGARVYVAYDVRATQLPTWLQSFTASGANLGTTDVALVLRHKDYGPGLVTLGGNLASPGNAETNYVVIIQWKPACGDGVDNDSDGQTDFPADAGCSSATDTDETNAPPPSGGKTLTWTDNANNETGFELEVQVNGGAWVKIAEPPQNATTATDPAWTVCYRIRAKNASGVSAYSNTACTVR